jgi:hypothetical protein
MGGVNTILGKMRQFIVEKRKIDDIPFFICAAISNNGLLTTKVFYIMLSQLFSFIIPFLDQPLGLELKRDENT